MQELLKIGEYLLLLPAISMEPNVPNIMVLTNSNVTVIWYDAANPTSKLTLLG